MKLQRFNQEASTIMGFLCIKFYDEYVKLFDYDGDFDGDFQDFAEKVFLKLFKPPNYQFLIFDNFVIKNPRKLRSEEIIDELNKVILFGGIG